MLFFPTTGIRALVIRIRIFLVCSVVAALTDLPHPKRIFLKLFFFSVNFQARLLFVGGSGLSTEVFQYTVVRLNSQKRFGGSRFERE